MKHLRSVLLILILGGTAYFFAVKLHENIEEVKALRLTVGLDLGLALALTLLSTLCATEAWRRAMNDMAAPARLRPLQGFAIVNISTLTKYLPGKVWSIALQTTWLSRYGFTPQVVVGGNLFLALIAVLVPASMGGLYLVLYEGDVTLGWRILGGALIVFLHALFAWQGKHIMPLFVRGLNRLLHRQMQVPTASSRAIITVQVGYLASEVCIGAAGYFAGQSLGLDYGPELLPTFLWSIPLANILAFIAVFVPGGFGVREGVLYASLRGIGGEALAVAVPIVTRLISMACELFFFGVAAWIYRTNRELAGDRLDHNR